jgi:hypothetical protein
MAVKYIFDGYYRSGTTAIWENLKMNNPSYTIYYEPFHPSLRRKISEREKVDRIHKKELWREYEYLSGDKGYLKIIDKLRHKKKYPEDFLKAYLSYYKGKSILQTNRLCFSYKDIKRINKDIEIIFIVRNPLDVSRSLYNYFIDKNISQFVQRLYYLKNGYPIFNSVFNIISNIEISYETSGFPKKWSDSNFRRYVLNNFNYLVSLSWLSSCRYAIKSNKISKIMVYENLVKGNNLIKFKDLTIDSSSIKNNYSEKSMYDSCFRIFKNLELNREYKEVYEAIFSKK